MGKTIIVTGGSSGIGLTAVRRLAAAGHTVFSASRNPDRGELPSGARPLVCDVGEENCHSIIEHVVAETGRLDALVNNAGVGSLSALEETSDADARWFTEVNLLGPMRLIRAAIPVMRTTGGGHIVNVTSLNDTLSAPLAGWYDATKAGLAALSYALAAEVKQFGIHVTVVSPGLFRTDMTAALSEFVPPEESRYATALRAMVQLQRARDASAGDPDEVGAAIASCIESDDPPVRIAVGADAQALAAMGADPNAYVPQMAAMITAATP